MRAPRPIPCPLCTTKLLPVHLSPEGTCYACYDAKYQSIASHRQAAEQRAREHSAEGRRRAQLMKRVAEAYKLKQEQREKRKQLEAERRQLLDVYRESASLALARKSLLYYTEQRVPNYKSNWFSEDVSRHLEKFYEDTVQGRHPRLILSCPARSGKTELASCSGPAWALGNYPFLNFILASYSDDLPLKMSRSIRAQLQSNEYRKVFPKGAIVSKYDSAANAWTTEQGGGVKTSSVTAGLLGHGCDILVLDDIISSAAVADNPKLLEDTYDWATSTAMSRLSERSGVLVIAQRLAPGDLIGRLVANQQAEEQRLAEMHAEIHNLQAMSYRSAQDEDHLQYLINEAAELDASIDRWTVIEYPVLATADEYLTAAGEIVRIADQREIQEDWRLLRRSGEPLQPARYSRSFLLKLRRANPRRFNAMYMLSPLADSGEFFVASDFRTYDPQRRPKHLTVYCAFDLAISTKTSADYTAGVAAGVDHNGNFYLLDIVRGRFGDLDLVADIIIDFHKKWGATITGVERTSLEMALAPILRRKMRERQTFIAMAEGKQALKPLSDKRVRARTLQALAKAGKVFIPSTGGIWDEFLAEATTFPSAGVHDDMVDAASYTAILQARDGLPRDPASNRPKPILPQTAYDRFFKNYRTGAIAPEDEFMAR